jgi:transcriptional regulator with XRE-family HTH domain
MMFAKRLKMLRVEKDLSQAEFGLIFGVSQQTVGSWEQSNSTPKLEMLVKIADYFDVSTDYLLGREGHNFSLSKEQKTLLYKFDSLKKEAQETVWTMLNSLQITHSTPNNFSVQNNNGNGNFIANNGNNYIMA